MLSAVTHCTHPFKDIEIPPVKTHLHQDPDDAPAIGDVDDKKLILMGQRGTALATGSALQTSEVSTASNKSVNTGKHTSPITEPERCTRVMIGFIQLH